MRIPIVLLLLAGLAGASGTLRAQSSFTDPDFGLEVSVPEGLQEVTPAHRALIMNVSEEAARNVPRDEAVDGELFSHHYFWVDGTSPYNRQMDVHVFDGPPPYRNSEELIEAYGKTGMTVEITEAVKPPIGGFRLEGSFKNQAGVPMRKTVVYVPDRNKFAMVSLQAYAADWAIVQPELMQAIQSIRLKREAPPAGAPTNSAAGRDGRAVRAPSSASVAEPIDWLSLPITGSLVLAALLLAHMLLGARSAR